MHKLADSEETEILFGAFCGPGLVRNTYKTGYTN